jgi:hypothetical protein
MAAITTMQFRRGTAAQWTSSNPVLSDGELGWEKDTAEFKIGNGVTAWNSLGYWISDVSGHTHPASQISDSTTLGRQLLAIVDAAAARTAIGAGTSNLALGTTASTAMAGNKSFSFSEITGMLGTAQLPPLAINEVFTAASAAEVQALTAQRGDMVIRTDTSTTYVLATDSPSTLSDWKVLASPGAVTSVAGRMGAVVLAKADVGLSNVDNTTDATKPVSAAQQTALNLKANLASPAFTGTPTGITKSHVGLSNVDNTADTAKPVSTAQTAAFAAKVHTHVSADITNIDGGTP